MAFFARRVRLCVPRPVSQPSARAHPRFPPAPASPPPQAARSQLARPFAAPGLRWNNAIAGPNLSVQPICSASAPLAFSFASLRPASPLSSPALPCSRTCSQRMALHTSRPLFAKDYYSLLGVSRDSSAADIKKSYYKLAKKYHPDANPDNEEAKAKFAEISSAYQTLSDPEKRQAYDMFGENAEQMGGPGGPGGPFGGFGGPGGSQFVDAEELFENLFGGNPFGGGFGGGRGGRSQAKQARRGSDIEQTLSISFMEAVNGCSKTLSVPTHVHCNTCDGKGGKPGAKASTCNACGGAGERTTRQGFFQLNMTCSACDGTGQNIPPCNSCSGEGLVRKTSEVIVTVPAGVDDKTNLRLVGQGNAGSHGGPRGHLWVKLRVESHQLFRRDGQDIHYTAELPVSKASLGGYINVPTLTGEARLEVPAGTQNGDRRAMRNKGIKHMTRSSVGAQFVHFKVVTPQLRTARQRELMEELARELGEADEPASASGSGAGAGGSGSFFGKIRNWAEGDKKDEEGEPKK